MHRRTHFALLLVANLLLLQMAPSHAQIRGSAAPAARIPTTFADLAARLSPAVVNISTTARVRTRSTPSLPRDFPFGDLFPFAFPDLDSLPRLRNATSLGSGFLISADGYIVTNNHVISRTDPAERVQSIKIRVAGGQEYPARIVGRDEPSDLAVLKIEGNDLPFVRFGDSTSARIGDWVIAIGNPFGLGGTVTAGIVSALHRDLRAGPYDRFIQTDASINAGSSGGPLFDMTGTVIGINTALISPTGGNVGIGFAIPADQARPVVETLIRGGRVRRGYLGLLVQPLTEDVARALNLPQNRGEIVTQVEPNLPAARAGLRAGDVIVRVNGQDIDLENSVARIIAAAPIGSRATIVVVRDGRRTTLTAVVAERPPESLASVQDDEFGLEESETAPASEKRSTSGLGLAVRPLTPELARRLNVSPQGGGVIVVHVDASSDAASKGIRPGDLVLSVNQRTIRSPEDARSAVQVARRAGRKNVLLLVKRGPAPPFFVGIELTDGG